MEAKERILVKSHELFNKYGIRSVSMDDIAGQLGMSKKTLYQYYADKDELVNSVYDIELNTNREHCLTCTRECENAVHEVFMAFDFVQNLLDAMNPSVLFDLQKYHPKGYGKFLEFRNSFLFQVLKDNLERGVREEVYRPDIDVDVLSRFRVFSILLSVNSEVFPNNKGNLVYIEQQLMEHFLYGMATPKGVKLIQKYKSQRTKK